MSAARAAFAFARRSRFVSTSLTDSLLCERQIERIARDLRSMPIRKLDGARAGESRRVAVVPLATLNADPCVVVAVYYDVNANEHRCALPSAAVEEFTLLESSSVQTTNAGRRAMEVVFGNAQATRSEWLGCVADVADARGRVVITPVVAFLGEVKELVRGRQDVAAISLSTLMSQSGVKPTREGGVEFIGTVSARGLVGHEAMGLHSALRVVAGSNAAYREALYDQFSKDYRQAKAVREKSSSSSSAFVGPDATAIG